MTKENLLQHAIQYHQTGDLTQAEILYQKLLTQNPHQSDVLHLLGILKGQQQKFVEAKTFIEKAIALDPSNPTYLNNLGNIYKNLNKPKLAIEFYQKALKILPSYAVAHNNLGTIYDHQQQYAEAEKHYREALRLKPSYADAHYNLANALFRQTKWQEAAKHYQQTIEIEPDHAKAYAQLAQVMQQQNEIEQAKKYYEKSLQLDPQQAEAQLNLGTILIKQGKLPEAIEHFLETLRLTPNHPEALHNLATTYLLLENLDEALKYFLQLLQFKQDAEIYYNIAVIFMHKDRHADAIVYFKEALQHNPEYFDAYLNLAATYLKIEDYENAIRYYQTALKLQPNNKEVMYILSALKQTEMPEAAPAEYLQHLFDQYAPYFEKHLKYLEYRVPDILYDAVTKVLTPEKNSLEILDLGCGTGLGGEKFKKLAKHLIGIDISTKMLEIAKQKNIYDVLKEDDITHALTEYNNLDLILAADVFNYFGDLAIILSKAHQALKNHALLAFTTEDTSHYPYLLQKNARFAHSQKYIEELAEKLGFSMKHFQQATLRKQKNIEVVGNVYILEKP